MTDTRVRSGISPSFANVTPTTAAHVLWRFYPTHPAALEPGSFLLALLDTIAAADPINRAHLRQTQWSGYVNAYTSAQEWDTALAVLAEIAESGRG